MKAALKPKISAYFSISMVSHMEDVFPPCPNHHNNISCFTQLDLRRMWRFCPPSMPWAWKKICFEVFMLTAPRLQWWEWRMALVLVLVTGFGKWIKKLICLIYEQHFVESFAVSVAKQFQAAGNPSPCSDPQVLSDHPPCSSVPFCRSWRVEMSSSSLRVEQESRDGSLLEGKASPWCFFGPWK